MVGRSSNSSDVGFLQALNTVASTNANIRIERGEAVSSALGMVGEERETGTKIRGVQRGGRTATAAIRLNLMVLI